MAKVLSEGDVPPARPITKADLRMIWEKKTCAILSRRIPLRMKLKELERFRLGFVYLRKNLEKRGCLADFL